MRHLKALSLLCSVVICSSLAQAEIYKWVDEKGRTHFDDRPPPHLNVKQATNVSAQFTSGRIVLADVDFADYNLSQCAYNADGNNGFKPKYADEIKELDCANVASLSGIESLTSLRQLMLFKTRIEDAAPLASLTDLDMLIIEEGKISDVTPFQHLNKLTLLQLKNLRISNVEPLSGLPGLIHLDLSGNQISNVSSLGMLPNLMTLGLGRNPVDCKDIASLYVNFVATSKYKKPVYTKISPRCEEEVRKRKFDIEVAEKSIKSEGAKRSADMGRVKTDPYIEQAVNLIQKADISGAESIMRERNLTVQNLSLNGVPVFNAVVKRYSTSGTLSFATVARPSSQNINADATFSTLNWLLAQGALIDAEDESGYRSISYLYEYGAMNESNKKMLMYLLERGADINYAPPNRANLLVAAVGAGGGDLGWVKQLIGLGADINAPSDLGTTALIMSYSNNFYDVFEYLLNRGADIHLRENKGLALIHFVAWDFGDDRFSAKAKAIATDLAARGLIFDLNNQSDKKAYIKCKKYLPDIFNNLRADQVIAVK